MATPPDIGALAEELRTTVVRLLRRLRTEHGFPIAQASVLSQLDRLGSRSIGDLAIAERVRPQSMAQTITDLETAELIARRPDPSDGRRVLLDLTDAGRKALVEERRQRDDWLAGVLADECTAHERAALAAALPLLQRIADTGE